MPMCLTSMCKQCIQMMYWFIQLALKEKYDLLYFPNGDNCKYCMTIISKDKKQTIRTLFHYRSLTLKILTA